MKKVHSAGVAVLRRQEGELRCLLMRHRQRHDLPKGHLKGKETVHQAALRELGEETGLGPEAVELDPRFSFSHTYYPRYRRFGGRRVEKTVTILLGYLVAEQPVRPTEHVGHCWVPLERRVGAETIDALLDRVERHLERRACLPASWAAG